MLSREFGINATRIEPLDGYDCENYLVQAHDEKFVLKIYQEGSESAEVLKSESRLLNLANDKELGVFPVPVKSEKGYVTKDGSGRLVRLLRFVEGTFLADAAPGISLMKSFGRFLGNWNKAFLDQRMPALEARRLEWHLENYRSVKKYLSYITEPSDRKVVEYFFQQNEDVLDDKFCSLRKSIIHGDAHDSNVLAYKDEVLGLIDFGDAAYCPLINEVAVALTYVLFQENDPLEKAKALLRAYHEVNPLEEKEIELLFNLIATRASISVCHAAFAKTKRPGDPYVLESEKPAWALLKTLVASNPKFYEDQFRGACGFTPLIEDEIEQELAERHRVTSKALSVTFKKPLKMESAAFQYMFDSLGDAYLDCYNNIPQVGHCHPKVVHAGRKAMARLNTNTRYLNETYNKYAERLLEKFPEKLTKVFFVNSGSAASDLALRLARGHTNKNSVLVMEHGYHGNTKTGIEISHYKYNRKGGTGRVEEVIEAPIPDTYKGEFRGPDAGKMFADKALSRIEGQEVAAFLAEPIVGCGGQVPLAPGYLKAIYPAIRTHGGVCISDEVQTGFGRLGKYFWGFEMHGVEPDIVIMGKPMGNGHPVAAVVTTDEIAESFETGMEFFSSFGGNPVSLSIADAVLDVLEKEELPENAAEVGGYLLAMLKKLVEEYEVAGDARGEGLFLGLELIRDGDPISPNTELAEKIKEDLRGKRIMIGIDGPDDNVIKIKPPICFTKENADRLIETIRSSLKHYEQYN
ncbi:MAG: aminotransferase class III-fold pyridoxal phosphate-dependent enzyme [Pyrinomonadaceae bacterium]|nr:aminotransferase class III-fold pyridoxal phosphate-dependent enzyme [Pyrinomonadaceae bacterium]